MTVGSPPEILRLLADAVRWQLVAELGRSDRRVSELVAILEKPQNLISYHLAELRDGGLVASRRSSADGRDVYYRTDLLRCRALFDELGRSLHPGLGLGATGWTTAAARRGQRSRPNLLFLCTGNSARSQMAEAFVEVRAAGGVKAQSAGSRPKPLHPNAVRVMAERGIDIAGRPSKSLDRFTHVRFDRVITLCDKVREVCPDFPGAPSLAHWSIADPSAAGDSDDATLEAFERVADEIDGRVSLMLAEFQQIQRIPHG